MDDDAGTSAAVVTLESVREQAAKILEADSHGGDPEGAHIDQDSLFAHVLTAVAAGHPDSAAMAAECLKVWKTRGTRWYA